MTTWKNLQNTADTGITNLETTASFIMEQIKPAGEIMISVQKYSSSVHLSVMEFKKHVIQGGQWEAGEMSDEVQWVHN